MQKNTHVKFTVEPAKSGERLDKVIINHVGDAFSRSQIQALIKAGVVQVDGETAKAGWRLKGGEKIEFTVTTQEQTEVIEPEPIPLDIIYEDESLAVINKPAGLVVHPGTGGEKGTLAHAILARYPEISLMNYAPQRRGIVHRLDKDTSGLILVARTERALRKLLAQFQQRTVDKTYVALCEKAPATMVGRVDAPIARDTLNRKKMVVRRDGRPAVSEFQVIERFKDGRALVSVNLLTGRTHQIRVHMAFINAPLVGDLVYGHRKQRLPLRRQFLHATKLCFDHPVTQERVCFESPLPENLSQILADLRRETGSLPSR